MESFVKQPYEEWTIAVDFTNRLPSGSTIATMVVSAVKESDGSNASSDVLDATDATINSAIVTVGVKGGSNEQDYILSFKGTLTPTGKVETDIRMKVRDS